ncbi:MAG: division/cell wall cluster transcriptional repressor MraZ [Spirochaetaceae bacterium]|nr:division/cell wall cluster transcriptional repressor MraZ [Spirochaetaceae bacterium]
MDSLTGKFRITLDDKGRINLPSRLRNALTGTTLILTQGADDCVWIYPPEEWERVRRSIMEMTSPFSSKSRSVRRRIIGPAQDMELDKAGRLPIPQSLREFAGLTKECLVIGLYDYIEVWNCDRYQAYLNATEEDFNAGSEELAMMLREKRDFLNKDGF